MSFGRHISDELWRADETVAPHVVAGCRQRATTGACKADDRRDRPAAGEQTPARRVWKADELGQPAHHRALEVNIGVIAGDNARIHRRCRQRSDDAGQGRRRVDPAEERRVTVAHRVRQHIPRHRCDQVVERRGLRRQRQVEQATFQPVGNRLPDRSRWQRREVVDDALDKRVRRAAKRP